MCLIRDRCVNYAKVSHLALFLKKLKYPLGAAGAASDAKVLIVPPSHKDVRDTFVESLRAALGTDALSDLNDKSSGKGQNKLEAAIAIDKFRRGRGHYWQCAQCGEVYEAATKACSTSTFNIRMEGQAQGAPHQEVLRFISDVEKVDSTGQREASQTIFIDNRVAVCTPGQRRRLHDPYGKVLAKGSCNGKRPQRAELLDAPEHSCFVLVLNASGIEGLDLGEATHLIKTEPMARADKEQQAEVHTPRSNAGTSHRRAL